MSRSHSVGASEEEEREEERRGNTNSVSEGMSERTKDAYVKRRDGAGVSPWDLAGNYERGLHATPADIMSEDFV